MGRCRASSSFMAAAGRAATAKEFMALNAYLAARDYVVVSINYRLAPKLRFPAGRDDVLSAIAYLKVYGHGVRPRRDAARPSRSIGRGQLALLAAYTAERAGDPRRRLRLRPDGHDVRVRASGIETLLDTRGVLESYLGGPPAKADDAYFAASPINFVNASSPPTLLIHGLHDGHVLARGKRAARRAAAEAKVKHLFVRLPWATHACDWSFSGPCGQITTYAVERFLEGVMFTPAADKPQGRLALGK